MTFLGEIIQIKAKKKEEKNRKQKLEDTCKMQVVHLITLISFTVRTSRPILEQNILGTSVQISRWTPSSDLRLQSWIVPLDLDNFYFSRQPFLLDYLYLCRRDISLCFLRFLLENRSTQTYARRTGALEFFYVLRF